MREGISVGANEGGQANVVKLPLGLDTMLQLGSPPSPDAAGRPTARSPSYTAHMISAAAEPPPHALVKKVSPHSRQVISYLSPSDARSSAGLTV
jgi:hypothetical protein